MNNRISQFESKNRDKEDRREPQPIGVILAELLGLYQARYPEVRIAIVETPAVTI